MEHKHDIKVALYGADGGRMGETFSRRARQLVKQQRATWMNEDHTAIQFIADEPEAWEAEPAPAHAPTDDDVALLEMARTRLSIRRWFFLQSILLIPGYLFVIILSEHFSGSPFDRGLLVGAGFMFWTMLFVLNLRRFIQHARGSGFFAFQERRRAQRLAEEVEYLRRMGYGK